MKKKNELCAILDILGCQKIEEYNDINLSEVNFLYWNQEINTLRKNTE